MRPRVFPAEDHARRHDGPDHRPLRASMRPRVFPAEDSVGAGALASGRAASMRPRVFPAEDK